MKTIKVLSTLAVMGAMRDLTRQFESATGTRVEAEFAPTVALLERLRSGDRRGRRAAHRTGDR